MIDAADDSPGAVVNGQGGGSEGRGEKEREMRKSKESNSARKAPAPGLGARLGSGQQLSLVDRTASVLVVTLENLFGLGIRLRLDANR
jgi:hypothetical protein